MILFRPLPIDDLGQVDAVLGDILKEDRLVPCKQRVVLLLAHAVRVLLLALEAHQVDHVDHADLELRERVAQDRQHRAVGRGGEELVELPARRERACLRPVVADHAGGDQTGVVRTAPNAWARE